MMESRVVTLIGMLVVLVLAGCSQSPSDITIPQSDQPAATGPIRVVEVDESVDIQMLEDGTKYIVHPDKIRGGGPPKDGIPSIDNPKFTDVETADIWIEDNEFVLALEYKGVTRVYPHQIMVWHEIVNDVVAGDPILITYCPLCGSGIAFERHLNGQEVEFGTSGKLFNSNLVMYDRLTDTYWQQIEGRAIVGELTGMKLTPVDLETVVWGEWKEAHPDSEVLTRMTGHIRNYGNDPYGNYYTDSNLFFPVEQEDDRLHPKTVVFGINVDGVYKAYVEDALKENPVVEEVVNGVNIRVERRADGAVDIVNVDTGEEFPKERDFWFAWYTFHPDTEVYQG